MKICLYFFKKKVAKILLNKLCKTLGRGMLLAVRWLVLVQIVVVTSREIGISPMVPNIFNSMIASLTEVGSECIDSKSLTYLGAYSLTLTMRLNLSRSHEL